MLGVEHLFMCISFQFLIADIVINIKLLTGEKSHKTKITRRKKIRNQFSRQFGKNGWNGATQIIKVLIEFFFVRVMKIIVWILASCVKYTLYIFVLKTSSSDCCSQRGFDGKAIYIFRGLVTPVYSIP